MFYELKAKDFNIGDIVFQRYGLFRKSFVLTKCVKFEELKVWIILSKPSPKEITEGKIKFNHNGYFIRRPKNVKITDNLVFEKGYQVHCAIEKVSDENHKYIGNNIQLQYNIGTGIISLANPIVLTYSDLF